MANFPTRIRQRLPLADLASAAVWASLGAALVIHGCAPDSVAKDPTATRRALPSAPVAVTPAAPAAPVAPVVVVAPVVPVFEQRPSVPSTEPDLRIRVAALRSASPVVRLTNPSGKLMMQGAGLAPRAVRTPVDVRQTANGWRVVELAGSKRAANLEVALAGPIEFHPPAGVHGVVAFDGTDWPGPLRLVPVTDEAGAIDVVIDVPLERYLPGVLAKELYRSWDLEVFKAQAIAARSFSICEHAHWSSVRHYDMIAGEASQAWVGVTKDPKPREAVQATRGMVLSFEGRVVPCYYSSTCGGTPANAAESLTRNPNHGIAPLAAGATKESAHRDCCADAPRFHWQQSFANAVICERIRRWATDQREAQVEREAQVVRLAQVERDGRMQPARAVAPVDGAALGKNASPLKGTATPITTTASASVAAAKALKVESVTSEPSVGARARTSALPSPAAGGTSVPAVVGVPVAPVQPAAPLQPAAQVPARNGIVDIADDAPLSELAALQSIRSINIMAVNAANRPTRLAIHDSTGHVLQLRAEDFRRAVNYAREGEPTPKDRLNSSHLLKVTVKGTEIQFVGQGFGHGVGMCQFGAQSMARSGANALLILRTYYPGAAVVRAY
jgi:SpoIID/LytB domain protein